MSHLEIIKAGLLTSVQDRGRTGLAYYAIPTSGFMDKNAARIALLLLNKKEDSALIECTSIAPQIKFHGETQIALTGADFSWMINDITVPLNTVLNIKFGDILKGKVAKNGFRGYIALAGDLKVEKVYNSYATYANANMGGHAGRFLKKGDVIEWENTLTRVINELPLIPIQKGPEFHFLNDQAQSDLCSNIYRVSPDSNRMGIRLQGEKLEVTQTLNNSVPVLSGFIQLPPDGLPIVILQDGQTTGGYPRVAYVPEEYLSALNQIPLGGAFQFRYK